MLGKTGAGKIQPNPEFRSTADLIASAAIESGNPDRLKAWWIYRILETDHPLEERLTLMWHNHFATSNLKVDDLNWMRRQNETFRRNAMAPFAELLRSSLKEPALLTWLDAPTNRKGHANENLARELMELFTLGSGNYTEKDVVEAARALTGWTVRDGEFYFKSSTHDGVEKTILGKRANLNGDDLVEWLLAKPATARRLAWRLTREFLGENVVSDEAVDELAQGLSKNNLSIRWAVNRILSSRLFFDSKNINTRICDPATALIAPLKLFAGVMKQPSTLILADWLARFGQDLFYPPNVGGWKGGRNWLTTRCVIARVNYAHAFCNGQLGSERRRLDIQKWNKEYGLENDLDDSIQFTADALFGRCDAELVSKIVEQSKEDTEGPPANVALGHLLAGPISFTH